MVRRWTGKRFSRRAGLLACLTCLSLLALGVSSAFAAQQVISTSGPINNIWLNDDLACQATHVGDTANEFYDGTNPGACGTFLATGGTAYGPSVPAGFSGTDFTPVSQTAVTGAGTTSNPYKVVTAVTVASTGLSITQTDSYVVGQEQYRTDITVFNSNGFAVGATLYHAGDCYLQGSDQGYGWIDSANHGIYCTANPNNNPSGRIVGFQPITGGSNFIESRFSTVWSGITSSGTQFPNTCDCTTFEDNGAGLSWPITVPAGSSTTVSLSTVMSPTGTTTPTPTPSPSPGPPALGKSFNAVPVSGRVYVRLPGSSPSGVASPGTGPGFVPLTQTSQFPVGTQVDARAGTIQLITATGNERGASTQTGTFNGGVFTVRQTRAGRNKGLTTLKLVYASFPGAPTYASCKAKKAEVGPIAQTAVSHSVLSTLHSRSKGKYSSSGRYGSATSRGTAWTLTDRCDGTLITVQKDKVVVRDFVHHRTITLRAGQRILIKARR